MKIQKERDDIQNQLQIQLQGKNEELITQKKLNKKAYDLQLQINKN